MGISTNFSLTNNKSITTSLPQKPVTLQQEKTVVQNQNHTIRDMSIGAVGAATVLISLGVLARNGKLGQRLQRIISGVKKETQKVAGYTELPNKPNINPADTHITQTNSQVKPKTTPQAVPAKPKKTPNPPASVETYTTKLPETIKEYTLKDIDICGNLGKNNFYTTAERKATSNILQKVQNRELTTIYNETEKSTNIIVPLGKNFYSIKINGIVSEEKAKTIVRTINANGLSDPNKFPTVIRDVLNGKSHTPYSIKNIGMYYDFHDSGAELFEGGGGKWATDGRILLRDVLKEKWEGHAISYSTPPGKRTTTQIAVALPANEGERWGSNHYAIFLDGLIPPGTCKKLVDFLQTKVVRNPKDVQFEELAKIQQATIDFLNRN